jgi:hypothetical protein
MVRTIASLTLPIEKMRKYRRVQALAMPTDADVTVKGYALILIPLFVAL